MRISDITGTIPYFSKLFFQVKFSKFSKVDFGKVWKSLENLENLEKTSEHISEGTRSLRYDISDDIRALFLHGRSPI